MVQILVQPKGSTGVYYNHKFIIIAIIMNRIPVQLIAFARHIFATNTIVCILIYF